VSLFYKPCLTSENAGRFSRIAHPIFPNQAIIFFQAAKTASVNGEAWPQSIFYKLEMFTTGSSVGGPGWLGIILTTLQSFSPGKRERNLPTTVLFPF
jgi:hypothetical protein